RFPASRTGTPSARRPPGRRRRAWRRSRPSRELALKLFVFGYGYAARALARRLRSDGWAVAATARTREAAEALAAEDVEPALIEDRAAMARAAADARAVLIAAPPRSEEHTSELQSRENLVCRPL